MSEISKKTTGRGDDQSRIEGLLAALAQANGMKRQEAREALVDIGRPAVDPLREALKDRRERVRWEAAKALSQIGDPRAAADLVQALEDRSFGVRWLAAEGLIAMRREGLIPLLQALVDRSDSAWLREGAHHILRTLAIKEDLHDQLTPLLQRLEDVEPTVEIPRAARETLEAL